MDDARMTRRDACRTLAAAAAVTLGAEAARAQEGPITVEPAETDELLANPHMGWQTFHRFADDDEALAGLPSSSAYFRFYWSQLERTKGRVDVDFIDSLLERAEMAGQKLAFRVMCAGTDDAYMHVPQWLKDMGCPGFEFRYGDDGPALHWVPDMDSPVFQQEHFRLIDTLGDRYDGDPRLDIVDIGSVGLWGEWHMSGTEVAMPKPETRAAIVDHWCQAFPRTPKVMLIGGGEDMKRAVAAGCGWRADCLGDMGGFSKTWNHMEHFYRQAVAKAEAEDAWKVAPVAFESCWDMRKWHDEGWDISAIFDYALDLHASYENNKSAPLPEGSREHVARLLRKLGYRLVPRRVTYRAHVRAGEALAVSIEWENVGVAPPYWDYYPAVQLVPEGRGEPVTAVSETTVRGWLPGQPERTDLRLDTTGLAAGDCALQVGIVEPGGRRPAVRLPVAGRREGNWSVIGPVRVAAP